jgi:hypothetical protein
MKAPFTTEKLSLLKAITQADCLERSFSKENEGWATPQTNPFRQRIMNTLLIMGNQFSLVIPN